MSVSISSRLLTGLLTGWQESGRGSSYERLATVLATLVLDGRLPVRARMPSERELAGALQVSRTTVAAAYARLREEGFLLSRQGAGSWTHLPTRPTRAVLPLLPGADIPADTLDLAIAAPLPDVDAMAEAAAAAAARLPAELGPSGSAAHGYQAAGLPSLRELIAARFSARGLPTSPRQILVTSGGQGAIHLLAQRLVGSRDVVLVEQPTYPNGVDAFRRTPARLVPVPVTSGGWDVAEFAGLFAQTTPRLAYVIADFQNPTGAVLDAGGRNALVAAAGRVGSLLLVDETNVELSLEGQTMPPPVAAFDHDGRVLTIGSMSKAFWGGLRVGWVRATPRLITELANERATVDLAPPVFDQLIAEHLLRFPEALLVRRRAALREQRDVMAAALAQSLPEWTFRMPGGGLALWVHLDEPVSTALVERAERHRLRLASGPRFGLDGTLERFLRLPFVLPPAALQEAVSRLVAAAADLTARPPATAGYSVIA